MRKLAQITSFDDKSGEAVLSFGMTNAFAYQHHCQEDDILGANKWVVCEVKNNILDESKLDIIEVFSLMNERECVKAILDRYEPEIRKDIFKYCPAIQDEMVEEYINKIERRVRIDIANTVDMFDIVEFANSISAKVHVSTRWKQGEEDDFSVDAIIKIPEVHDDYLKALIKKYSHNLFHEHSMTALYNERRPEAYETSKNKLLIEVKRQFVLAYNRSDYIKYLLDIKLKEASKRAYENLGLFGKVENASKSL